MLTNWEYMVPVLRCVNFFVIMHALVWGVRLSVPLHPSEVHRMSVGLKLKLPRKSDGLVFRSSNRTSPKFIQARWSIRVLLNIRFFSAKYFITFKN